MFIAMYVCVLPPNKKEDPSRKGFRSTEEAWEWIFANHMCETCIAERARWKAGKDTPYRGVYPHEYPGCAFDWEVLPSTDFLPADVKRFKHVDTDTK